MSKEKDVNLLPKSKRIKLNGMKSCMHMPKSAVCISAILNYYGKYLSPLEIAKDYIQLDEIDKEFQQVKRYGLTVESQLVSASKIIEYDLPLITLLDGAPVVITSVSSKKIGFFDAYLGEKSMTVEVFQEKFGGIIYELRPENPFLDNEESFSLFNKFVASLRKNRNIFIAGCVLLSLIAIILIGAMASIRVVPDYLLNYNQKQWSGYGVFVFLNALIFFLSVVCVYYNLEKMSSQNSVKRKGAFLWKLLATPYKLLVSKGPFYYGSLSSFTSNISSYSYRCATYFMSFAVIGSVLIVYLSVYSLLLALMSVGLVLLCAVSTTVFFYLTKNVVDNELRSKVEYELQLKRICENGNVLKVSGRNIGGSDRIMNYWKTYQVAHQKAKNFQLIAQGSSWIFVATSLILNLSTGIYLYIIDSSVTLGKLLVFICVSLISLFPLSNLYGIIKKMYVIKEQTVYLEEFLALKEQIEEIDYQPIELLGQIEGNNISYKDESGYEVLSNANFVIESGGRVAITGDSGCGKSSLIRIMIGMEEFDGDITYDGINVKKLGQEFLSKSVSVISNPCRLFNGTVYDNLVCYDNSIELSDVIQASRIVELHESIIKNKDGYYRKIIGQGENLSKSQRVKIELARVLLRNSKIIIIDEATECLDIQSETRILNTLREMGITVILFTCREESISLCDSIYNIKNKTII